MHRLLCLDFAALGVPALAVQLFPLVIGGELSLAGFNFYLQKPKGIFLLLGALPNGSECIQPGGKLGQLLPGSLPLPAGPGDALLLADPPVQSLPFLAKGLLQAETFLQSGGILLQKAVQQGQNLLFLRRLLPGLQALLRGADAVDVLADAAAEGLIGLFPLGGLPFQGLLELLVGTGVENFPENFAALFGLGQQKIQKLPLGDHGHPGKLCPVQANHITHGPGYLPGAGDRRPAVGIGQQSVRLFCHQLVPPLGRAQVLRVPPDGVLLGAAPEGQLHKGGSPRLCITAAEHGRLPVGAAGLPVKGKGDGVKQAGFPRPGVAGDEIQSLLAQLGKVHLHLIPVGTKGGQGQFHGSHGSPSQISSIRPVSRVSCPGLMGWLFCSW